MTIEIDESLENTKSKKETTHFVNVKFTTENAEYSPRVALAVNNKAGDAQLKLLDYLVENGSTATLKIQLSSISIGSSYASETVEDDALDLLLGTKAEDSDAPLLEEVKKYEPALFWINTELTSSHLEEPDGSEGTIRTSGISIDKNAPRQFLSDLLKVINEDAEMMVEVTSVKHVKPLNNTKLKPLDFLK